MDMKTMYYTEFESQIGTLLLASSDSALMAIQLPGESIQHQLDHLRVQFNQAEWIKDSSKNKESIRQLKEYFAGKRTHFDLPYELLGSEFRKSVLSAVMEVPYGQTKSYGDIARMIGSPKACRAVGSVNRTNPIPIVIPCHRIIGTNGSLTGYGGGLKLKKRLLDFEKSNSV